MMTSANAQNDFLLELLALQQDGRHAISAPTNWTHDPLLDIRTEVDAIVDELQGATLVGGNGTDTARWHFFIGSPGNGKSAAMGKLCRRFISSYECQVQDEDGVALADLEPAAIPYAINVYEDGNKFATAQIVQDASVVRNPFSPNVDPATELLHFTDNLHESRRHRESAQGQSHEQGHQFEAVVQDSRCTCGD